MPCDVCKHASMIGTVAIEKLLDGMFTFGFLKELEPAVHSPSWSSLYQHHPCTPVNDTRWALSALQ